MRIVIPTIGSKLKLIKPWSFTLYPEYRNDNFWFAIFGKCEDFGWYISWNPDKGGKRKIVVIPKDTVLIVDRIYLRKGNGDYDSVSFRIDECSMLDLVKKRFWAKLEDVNSIFGDWDMTTIKIRKEEENE